MPLTEERETMGTATAPNMALPRYKTMDQIPPTCLLQGGPNQQYSIFQTNSNTMVRRMRIWHCRLHRKFIIMAMDISIRMSREICTESIRILSICYINLHDNPEIRTWFTHLGIHRQFQSTWLDAQGILLSSE